MALHQGELVEWNDDRGFGFIRPDGGSERLFVHISEIARIATRPRMGDRVSFAVGPGRGGKPAAIKVTIAGANPFKARALMRGTEPQAKPRRGARLPIALGLIALLVFGGVSGSIPLALLGLYGVMGAVSAGLYFSDKHSAQTGAWRTSEDMLHGVDLAFGIIGGLLGQQLFHHKTAKPNFALITYGLAALHAVWLVGLVTGRISLAELMALIPV